jgi:hypothetical protein
MLAMCLAFTASRLSLAWQMKSEPSLTLPPTTLPAAEKKPEARGNYVGDAACGLCHQDQARTYSRTAHHWTSQVAGKDSIAGKFISGANVLKTSNPGLLFRMDARADGFYQTAVLGIEPVTRERSERFDLAVGSGRKGQTYLYWKGDQLFQLPVSYWVELGQWVNSPGFRDGAADFNRPVVPRCLECHATYAESVAGPPPPNHYTKGSVALGIACERCHGPGVDHVAAHRSGTAGISGRPIVNPGKLPRDRQVEVCAQCHGGPGKRLLASLFNYVPGTPLDDYIERDHFDPAANIDVHGNQVALLQRSLCFQSSPDMSCSTCHNVHEPQRDAAAFSERCLTCHKPESCGMYPKIGAQIANRCVDCHMPNQESNLIVSDSNGKQVKPMVRTHWIKVYPEAQTQERR